MIVATGALLVMMILVAAVQSGAISVRNSSSKDRNSKRALAAANAGLSVATDRVLRMKPAGDLCLADDPVPVDSISGECPSSTPTSLGGGASYSYTVTPVLSAGDSCRSVPTSPPLTSTDVVRCITSIGRANGVTRRVQSRLVWLPQFPFLGILGLSSVFVNDQTTVYGDVTGSTLGDIGTNGSATVGPSANASLIRNAYLAPGATATNISPSQQIPVSTPYSLPLPPFEPAENVNVNASIPATPGWNAAARELDLVNSSLTLTQSGVYSFCRIQLVNSHLYVAPGVKAQIYIDSPSRNSTSADPASSCAAGGSTPGLAGGTVGVTNGSSIEACATLSPCTSGPAANLVMYVYGRGMNPDVNIVNGSTFNGGLYAPRSIVRIISDSVFRGSIAANDVSLISNVTFRADPSLMRIAATFKSRYWTECTPQMTNPPDPESGC